MASASRARVIVARDLEERGEMDACIACMADGCITASLQNGAATRSSRRRRHKNAAVGSGKKEDVRREHLSPTEHAACSRFGRNRR